MRYERDNSLSNAVGIIRFRIKGLREYFEGKDRVVKAACDICRDKDVEGMKALGGFSAVAARIIAELPEEYRANRGSKMFPTSVADILREEIPNILNEVKRKLLSERFCKDCGNPDCPKVSAAPYFRVCPRDL